jgi:crotonobetaine/carnitine-CoA ligase
VADAETLGELLRHRARHSGDRLFLRLDGARLTFGEFDFECNRVAHGFAELGVARGEVVAVMLPNSLEFLISWFALAKLGACEAAINTAFRGRGLAHMLKLTRSRVLVVDEGFLDAVEAVADSLPELRLLVVRGDAVSAGRRFPGRTVISFGDLARDRSDDPQVPVRASELAMLLFTSGTTGPSKACMLSHRYAIRQAELIARHLGLRRDDVFYSPFPLFHADAATLTVVPAVMLGATAALASRFSVSRFWDQVREYEATVFDFLGATLTMLWKQPPRPDDRDNPARLAWGVPMPSFASEFEERFDLTLVEVYGLTDAGHVVYHPLDEPRRPGACGKAVHPYDVRIFDDDDRELPPGEVGEIVVRPLEPSVIMDGYYRMPEETLAAFRTLWFHTGDLARRDEDGYFYFAGRKKDAIRRRGENISAYEIEEAVAAHPAILEAAAVGVPSELTEEEVKLCVVLRSGASLAANDLVAFCRERMAKFMVPRYVEFMSELPKTPTQKVEKYRLRDAGVTAATWDSEATDGAARSPAGS